MLSYVVTYLGRIGLLSGQNIIYQIKNVTTMRKRDFRLTDELYNSIPGPNKSSWVRKAIHQGLQEEMGLTSEYTEELKEIKGILRGLGTNINQLAKQSNQGLPVTMSKTEKDILLKAIVDTDKHTKKVLRLLDV